MAGHGERAGGEGRLCRQLKVPVPNTVAPSLNVTVPVAGPPDTVTVAVKVTDVP